MSEERKLILEMVAAGKITPDEAEMLLQAVDESERTVRLAAAGHNPIEQVVSDSLQGLDRTLRGLEAKLERKLGEHRPDELRLRIEERVRRAAERAAERATEAEERAARAVERATERAAERAGHIADRIAEKWTSKVERASIIKVGISLDRETVAQQERLTTPGQPGDRLVLDNRIGDVTVLFAEGSEIAVEARKTVWGADRADAEERAALTKLYLARRGSDVVLEAAHPSISAAGLVVLKDTRLDYIIRVPHGTNLQVHNKVGDLRVEAGDQVGNWDLQTKVGDVVLRVGAGAGFRHRLESKVGRVQLDVADSRPGQVGDGTGSIEAIVKTGDIRLQH